MIIISNVPSGLSVNCNDCWRNFLEIVDQPFYQMGLRACQHRRMKSSALSSGKAMLFFYKSWLNVNPCAKLKLNLILFRRLPEFKFWYSATKATVTFIIIIIQLTTWMSLVKVVSWMLIPGDCFLLYLFPSFQHPGVLADPRHVLHYPLLHHYEEADQGIDSL